MHSERQPVSVHRIEQHSIMQHHSQVDWSYALRICSTAEWMHYEMIISVAKAKAHAARR